METKTKEEKKEISVAIAGNPNSGKTSLFNELTGARQHVGNYPGVTVEKREGSYSEDGKRMHVVDLPGTYSLTAYSLEEVVARDFLTGEKPDVVVDIVDESNLERNLYLTVQFLEMGVPLCMALNMTDVAEKRGIKVDRNRLSQILNIPVVPTVARSGKGKKELMEAAEKVATESKGRKPLEISYGSDIDNVLIEMQEIIKDSEFLTDRYPVRWTALKYLENDMEVISKGRQKDQTVSKRLENLVRLVSEHLTKTMDTYPEAVISDYRYGYIKTVVQEVLQRQHDENRLFLSDNIDKILTNRFLGPLIMLLVVFGLYQFTFTYSETPVGWFEAFFGWLGGVAESVLPDGLLKSLVISGMIDGVGGVLGFVPIIVFMFLGIAVLEDAGYLARVAYMLDRVFRVFGLHGSSVMAYIVSGGIAGGCAVPGVMAARTLRSPRERLATILTAPFMNCGAKLPVFALLIGAFFTENEARIMFLITLIAWGGALLAAKGLRMTVIKGAATPFVMELPPYRVPTIKGVLIHTWERTWQYIKKAGTVILGISIILWTMMTFPGLPEDQAAGFEKERATITASFSDRIVKELEAGDENAERSPEAKELKERLTAVDGAEAEAALRYSIAGRMGTALESFSKWAGYDWRTNIALVGGFAAKEVVVSTLGTAYSLGEVDPEETGSLSKTLSKSSNWSPLVAFSLIIFTIFYAPCFVTVVCLAKEAGSWKWGAFSMIFNTVLAYVLAVLVFQVGSLLGY